jgi:uncharacterized membrane protein
MPRTEGVIVNPVFSSGVKDLARTISNHPAWATLKFVAYHRALIRRSVPVRTLPSIEYSQETEMEAARFAAMVIAIFAGLFVSFFCVFIGAFDPSGERRKAARDKRMAEHQMAARLLRLNI